MLSYILQKLPQWPTFELERHLLQKGVQYKVYAQALFNMQKQARETIVLTGLGDDFHGKPWDASRNKVVRWPKKNGQDACMLNGKRFLGVGNERCQQ